eukprot:4776-Pyramimonas_sp.AAC.4
MLYVFVVLDGTSRNRQEPTEEPVTVETCKQLKPCTCPVIGCFCATCCYCEVKCKRSASLRRLAGWGTLPQVDLRPVNPRSTPGQTIGQWLPALRLSKLTHSKLEF